MNYKVNISYDGTNFFGWAKQNTNVRTIQNEIEIVLNEIFQKKISIFASGRTDKFVHAIDQCFHFKAETNIPLESLQEILNAKLPSDIIVNSIKIVNDKFHSRFSIIDKTYLYKINIGNYNIFERNYVYQYCKNIDIHKIKAILNLFIGKKDFLSFSTTEVEQTIREIKNFVIERINNYIIFKITGNGFLRNMVRMIVGVLLKYNEDNITYHEILMLFNNPKKGSSIVKVPGCGLYLYQTNY